MADGMFQDIADYIRVSKDALDLMKGAIGLLPKGSGRDQAEHRLKTAEEALKRSDAALAQKLGYKLCECTFPPQIMLWREKEGAHRCPNPECERTIKSFERRILDGNMPFA